MLIQFKPVMYMYVLLVYIGLSHSATNPVLVPVVATTYFGGNIRFTCMKPNENMQIGWYSVLFPLYFTSGSGINATLDTDVPDASANNTEIKCVGRYPSNPTQLYFSNPSTIIIQGYLSTVQPSISANPCTLLIYWDPPFTLPGVPILGYNINITNTVTNEINYKTFVTVTQVHVPLGYYTVSIAGVNPVGEGNISTIYVDPTQYSTDFNTSNNVTVSRNGSEWTVQVIVENNVLCGQNMEDSLSMNIINQKDATDVYSASDVTQSTVNNLMVLSGTLSLPADHHYWINIAINIGNYTRMSGYINLSTFDVQDIKVLNVTNDEICLDIKYVPGSVATGCSVDLESPYGSISPIRNNITFLTNSSCAYIGFDSLRDAKKIILKAYDMVYDKIEDENGPAVEVNITITPAISRSSLIYSISASINSTITPSVSITEDGNIDVVYGIVPSVFIVFIILTIAAAILMIVFTYIIKRKRKNHKVVIPGVLITYNQNQGSTSSASHDVDNGGGVLTSVSIVKRPESPFVNPSDSETLHINDIQPDRLK